MAKRRKRKPPDVDKFSANLAKLIDLKRRLLEVSERLGKKEFAESLVRETALAVKAVREDLEAARRYDMSAEDEQTRIHLLRIFEDVFLVRQTPRTKGST